MSHAGELRVGAYEVLVEKKIAEGGFGLIYLVSDVHMARDATYCLKKMAINRQESYDTVKKEVTMLNKFRTQEFSWLRFPGCSEDKVKYFMNENDFVLWRLLKWVFEDLLVTLSRCFFYCTEKQKEYSRIFYYRKGIWNLIM